jgi:hypothetical protein
LPIVNLFNGEGHKYLPTKANKNIDETKNAFLDGNNDNETQAASKIIQVHVSEGV